MGIKSSSTCVMHYNDAKAWLVGDLNKGMKAMFIMMNGARLMVGVQGLGMSEVPINLLYIMQKNVFKGDLLRELKSQKCLQIL